MEDTFYKNSKQKDEVYSRRVNAGKRVYFFDIKKTRGGDYYITITESKKKTFQEKDIHGNDVAGDSFSYEKHKVFLYKEDVNKFMHGMMETVHFFKTKLLSDYDFTQFENQTEE